MRVRKRAFAALLAMALPTLAAPRDVLWTNPAELASRDLFYGPGGRVHLPHGPFTFVKEDLDGTNPKFAVRDRDGIKWKVKMGIEAQPETVASRLVWAVGYRATEDYFIANMRVRGMPARLHRGSQLVGAGGWLHNVRLKREPSNDREKKLGEWSWRHNPFAGTRELNGLRTLMSVLNNWDLKDENNAIYQQDGERIYLVKDLGATFGCAGLCWPRHRDKGDFENYRRSRFIRSLTPTTVSFECPARPRYVFAVDPKNYIERLRVKWIGRNIPRADAHWMGEILARLSRRQIQDAFRAAGYSEGDIDAFSTVLERRIAVLTDL